MAVEVKVPSVGESITEGTIARWLKQDGAGVRSGDPLFELETDKATTEVPAQASGRLKITVPEGKTVPVGAVVATIEEGNAAAEPPKKQERTTKPAQPAKEGKLAAEPPKSKDRAAKPEQPPKPVVPHTPESPPAPVAPALSPSARRLAAEKGLSPEQLTGVGRGGRITKEDILTHLEQKTAPTPAPEPTLSPPEKPLAPAPLDGARRRETRERMSAVRQRIAERLVAAQHHAAILTTFNEADLSEVMALRAKYKESFQKKHGVGLGFMSFFVKACVEALQAFPAVNGQIDGTDVVYQNFYDIGVAVSTDKGLMVPILRSADQLSFAQIEKSINDLAEKARAGKINVADLRGGTFTITNGGVYGSLLSTPLLNPPQSGILGMHAIQKRPVVVEDQIVIRPMMYLALSYDHRLIDGREAVRFLVRVKECIESPERLLLAV
jgi:2-oxoglutarate dehydrogenase E2 component (dihydrolipoamide succinyltransferase)